MGTTTSHVLRRAVYGIVAALILALSVVSMAQAAPTLGVDVVRDQATVNHGDGLVSYTVKVTNTTPANLTCKTGNWTGAPAPTFTYKWLRDGVPIPGETGTSYTLQPVDQGRSIQCQVTGSNAGAASVQITEPRYIGPTPSFGPPSGFGRPAGVPRPVIAAAPAATSGSVQTCTAPANWDGAPTWTFEWLRNGEPATGPTATPTATTSTYTVQPEDVSPGAVLQCKATATNAIGSVSVVSANKNSSPAPPGPPANSGTPVNMPTLAGAEYLSGPVTVSFNFPAGVKLATGGTPAGVGANPWFCQTVASSCTATVAAAPGTSLAELKVTAWIYPEQAPDVISATVTAFGGGSASSAIGQDSVILGPALPFALASLTAEAKDFAGADYTQAGGHPFSATTSFETHTIQSPSRPASNGENGSTVVEALRDAFVNLPVGFIGNPQASTDVCTVRQVQDRLCPESAAVGGIFVKFSNVAVNPVAIYRVRPSNGYPAAFAVRPVSISSLTILLRPKVRPGDYGVTVVSPLPPQYPEAIGVDFATLCSYGAKITDPFSGTYGGCKQRDDVGAFKVPFLTNPTECSGTKPVTSVTVDSFEHPGAQTADGFPDLSDDRWKSRSVTTPLITGCGQVPFDPGMSITPTSADPDSASGLDVDLRLPQDGLLDPDGIATAHLEKVHVELPDGFSVNPSAATGLEACSDAQMAEERQAPPSCPDGSKLGTATVTSPIVDQALHGTMYLGTPKSTDPQSGEMFRLWLSVRNDELGVSAKLPGSAVADPLTGRLTATFDNNPRLPFDHLSVKLKGGSRGILATPQTCGPREIAATLTPWSGTAPVTQTSSVNVQGDCGFGFAPSLRAGMSTPQARQSGDFSFQVTRRDGEQWFTGLTAGLPAGLLASVKGVPLCSSSQAAVGACPAGSRIGTVDATAGSGSPFVLEKKGSAFLTEGYKGCAYGLVVTVPVVAGPFDGKTPATDLGSIVVRQSVCVDPTDAHVTVTSDPLPQIWHGIPLRVRSITVKVDRPAFMVNPTNCTPSLVRSTVRATGGFATPAVPFNVSGCAGLPLKPKMAMELQGKKQTKRGQHPTLVTTLTQRGDESNLKKVRVRLPLSLALDPDNAEALCKPEQAAAHACPAASIVGKATAVSPVLNRPLHGDVFFVEGTRQSKQGRTVKTLPKLWVALRGEVAIDLWADSSIEKGKYLVTTFPFVPDAPISSFKLDINGGKHGILAVTGDTGASLCKQDLVTLVQYDGQNGKLVDDRVKMGTPCGFAVRSKTVSSRRAKVRISGIGPGRLTVSGKGVHRTSRTIKRATTASLAPRLTKTGKRLYRDRRAIRLRVSWNPKAKGEKTKHTKTTVKRAKKASSSTRSHRSSRTR